MVRLSLLLPSVAVAADPERPHLAQAWTARSVGDGEPDTVGQESYLNMKEKWGHIYDYGAEGGKITRCGKDFVHSPDCTAYYLKLYGPNCCYCKGATFKEWDIHQKPATGITSAFVGFNDTTELDDKPVVGAEHWHEDDTLFGKLKLASYEYFIHRENNSDVISHRIDFSAAAIQGTILYGDFQVQHDPEAFSSAWDLPPQCLGNILDCGCDDTDEVHQKYFKHEYALAKAKKSLMTVPTVSGVADPAENEHHYGAPPSCKDDEIVGTLDQETSMCAAECPCSTDFPEDMSDPQPQCILQASDTGKLYCGLTCGILAGDCPSTAKCSSPIVGVCQYDVPPSGKTNGAINMNLMQSVAV